MLSSHVEETLSCKNRKCLFNPMVKTFPSSLNTTQENHPLKPESYMEIEQSMTTVIKNVSLFITGNPSCPHFFLCKRVLQHICENINPLKPSQLER